MSILAAFAVPHPPILVHGVGRGEERGAQTTLDAYHTVARRIGELAPELIIIATPHGELFRDALRVSTGSGASGSFAQFGDPSDRFEVSFDEEFIETLLAVCAGGDVSADAGGAETRGSDQGAVDVVPLHPDISGSLDHGCLVPLYFINQYLKSPYMLVRLAISFLDEQTHYRMGRCIDRVVETIGRRAVFVASGDLSHRLKADGPYGFNPAGPRFDAALTAAFAAGDFDALMRFDAMLRDEAAECGLNSFIIMAGALGDRKVHPELLSYEGPWGVGYGIASFVPKEFTGTNDGESVPLSPASNTCDKRNVPCHTQSSLPVRLAFAALEDWLAGFALPSEATPAVAALIAGLNRTDFAESADFALLETLLQERAGAFLSFHKGDDLRGCIGTLAATRASLFEEICHNTVSAAGSDPRFPAIRTDEMAALSCSVDVMGEPEPVADPTAPDALDAKRYGVIVSRGFRRGVLLPDLEGVETPSDQIAIALSKAGIAPTERYELERFEVVRWK